MASAPPEVARLAEAQLNFSASLYKEIYVLHPNLVFSPTSVWAILAMLGAGSKGETVTQIVEALNLPSLDSSAEVHGTFEKVMGALIEGNSSSIQIIIACSLFLQVDFSVVAEFQDLLQKHYQASVEYVDYQNDKYKACDDINGWTATQTKDKIKDLLSPSLVADDTKLALVNAIYMKGLWAKPFDSSRTTPEAFHMLDGTERAVDMMYQKGKFRFGRNEKHHSLILEMPYDGDQFSMYLFLPENPEAFKTLEESLSGEVITELLSSLQRTTSVFLWLPRFQAESKLSLDNVLPQLGIENLFLEHHADLSGIHESNDLVVSTILHQCVIVVDEEGSEAAAATAAVMRLKRSMEISEEFQANRPFLYLIRHIQSGAPLFIGRLTSPPESTAAKKDEL